MQRFRGRLLPRIALILSIALLPLTASSQDSALAAREVLAASILSDKSQEDLEGAMTEGTSRLMFKKLRVDPAWGPEHANWKKLFSEFSMEFKSLNKRFAPGFDGRLQTALVTALTEKELTEIDTVLKDDLSVEGDRLLRRNGIDHAFSFRMAAMSAMPSLYSQAEKSALKDQLLALKASQGELAALKPRLEAALAGENTPAFTKYRQLLRSTAMQFIHRMDTDEPVKQAVIAFMVSWQPRVMQE